VLPVFGGTAAVWTTALCFFTGMLFVGYLYAHVVITRLGPRGPYVHLGVAAVAIVAMILAPANIASLRTPGAPEALNVLYVLLVIAGAPAFLLASTSPLLSAWFAGRGGDPWWLYAASNGASFLALITYPFILEPFVGLAAQRVLLTLVLIAFVAALALVVILGRRAASLDADQQPVAGAQRQSKRRRRQRTMEVSNPAAESPRKRLTIRRRLTWLIAASIPAGLLSATTSHLATDLVSAPLLWVGPLAIYLASFVVAFSVRGRRALSVVELLVPAAATLLWVPFVRSLGWPIIPLLVIELGAFGVLAVAIHGRLALDRPGAEHLTAFYLLISAGGVLATAAVALVAPLVFSGLYEYPILVVAGVAVLTILPGPNRASEAPGKLAFARRSAGRTIPYIIIAAALFGLVVLDFSDSTWAIGLLLAIGAVVVALTWSPTSLAIATALVIVVASVATSPQPLLQVRTFFGIIQVRSDLGGTAHAEYSGTTLHGIQFLDDRSSQPTSYYVRSGPLGDVFDDLRGRTRDPSIGVVGLGTGDIAAYEQAGDTMTFYEIDPAVVAIAENPAYFTYLRAAPSPPRIVIGDARLSIESEAPGLYDLLILDAFSSDAVPAHLLTREAMMAYQRVMRPGGLIVFHVSNRSYSL
ncbi:MAG: spermidine synthase, partial [Thermoanaerobaculia bacterium]